MSKSRSRPSCLPRSAAHRSARPALRAWSSALAWPLSLVLRLLRHATGDALANKGHDTRALQAYLGHQNIQHTVRYTELSPDGSRTSGADHVTVPPDQLALHPTVIAGERLEDDFVVVWDGIRIGRIFTVRRPGLVVERHRSRSAAAAGLARRRRGSRAVQGALQNRVAGMYCPLE